MTLGWYGVPLSVWPRWLPATGRLTRDHRFRPSPYSDAVVLSLPAAGGRRVRLRHDVALVWSLCLGVDRNSVIRDADLLRSRAPAFDGLDADRTDHILRRLTGAGLVADGSGGPAQDT